MSSNAVTIEQARAKLGDLVIAAMRGETTVLTRYGKPVAQITPYVEESAMAVTYTHPDLPRLALRAEDLGNGVWRRSLLIDGVVTHSTDRPEVEADRHNPRTQASQAGFVITALAHAVGRDAADAAKAREAIGEHELAIGDLASHIALGRATEHTTVTTYTAAIGLISSIVAGDHCDVSVIENDAEGNMTSTVALEAVELDVRTDDDDVAGKVYSAADAALTAQGWRRTDEWDDAAGDAAYAPVERA